MLKKNITRKDLYNKINQTIGFSKSTSSNIIDDFFEILIKEIIENNEVKITSFGTFQVINKKERIGRNPKTKVETKITSRKVVRFRPSLFIKDKINKE